MKFIAIIIINFIIKGSNIQIRISMGQVLQANDECYFTTTAK